MLIYTCEQMRVIEENADVIGLSYVQMMENAGKVCAEKFDAVMSAKKSNKSITILCGTGKNGGDGYVIARHLSDKGYGVRIIAVGGYPSAYESKLMYAKLDDKPILISEFEKNYQLSVSSCMDSGAIIDCVFGIGFHGELSENISKFFKDIECSKALKFAVDIPSGLEGNSGSINSAYFKADYTFAITCFKPVHIIKPAADCCGKLVLINIGIPETCYEAVKSEVLVSADIPEIKRFFKPRQSNANKGDFGKLLCIAGSRNMQGACVMATNAAINSGVGIVTAMFPKSAYTAIASKVTEALTIPVEEDSEGFLSVDALPKIISHAEKATAILIGCGIGVTNDTIKIVNDVILQSKCPIILDADGINAVSMNISILKESSAPIIITPHPGEMARLTGMSIEDIQKDRIGVAKSFASEYGCIVVLKGANTVVASPSGSVYINRTGNAGMATGGSGDVLAGIISSFVCQSMSLQSAAISGVFVHGLCGDNVRDKLSMRGVTPTGIIDELAETLSKFE